MSKLGFGQIAFDKALEVEALDHDLFRSVSLWTPRGARGTFGGQLVAHCVESAMRTVRPDLNVHSLHSNFLHRGNSDLPIYYRVRRLRDGKSMAVRHVTARQQGMTLFAATISFHIEEKPGIQHFPNRPQVAPPEQAKTESDVMKELLERGDIPDQFKENIRRKMNQATAAVEIRYVNPGTFVNPKKTQEPQYCWMRCKTAAVPVQAPRDVSGGTDRVHLHIASWLSDFTLAFSSIVPHGYPNSNIAMMVSLDHTVYFHTPHFKSTEWFLYEVRSVWADNNRALCLGRIFTADGHLAISTFQECMVRMKKGYVSRVELADSKL